MKMYQNMTQCDKLIQDACKLNVSQKDKTEVEGCFKTMGEFRKQTEVCKTSSTNCTCWNSLIGDVKAVQACSKVGKLNLFFFYAKYEYF